MTASPATVLFIRPPDPLDLCDVDDVAKGIVSFVFESSTGELKRLVYCAHHWDERPAALAALVRGHHDLRADGIFDPPKPVGG